MDTLTTNMMLARTDSQGNYISSYDRAIAKCEYTSVMPGVTDYELRAQRVAERTKACIEEYKKVQNLHIER